MKLIPASEITLNWTCEECDEKVQQPLTDIVEVGTAICPECGDDMTLEEEVQVGKGE